MTNMDIKPVFDEVDAKVPNIQSMERSSRSTLDTGVTYNQAGATYNTLGTAYGGIYGGDGDSPAFDGR